MATWRACVVVLGLAVLALVAAASPSQSGVFTATSGANLWTYPNPEALANFEARVVPVPALSGLLDPKLIAAAASGETPTSGGGFAVVSTNAMAVQRPGRNFTKVDFGGQGFLFTDLAYVPSTSIIVAVALQPTSWGNLVAFLRSEDGGVTWTQSYAESYTDGLSCSISLSSGLGVVVCDTLVFNSFDDGRTWKLSWVPQRNVRVHKAATLDPGLGLIAGAGAWLWPQSGSSGGLWYQVPLPISSPATVTGLTMIEEETWVVATSTGQIWRTELGGSQWDLVLARSNITWTDVTHSGSAVLAVGRYALSFVHEGGGVMALSWDAGKEWVLSPPQPAARFTRVVPGVPSV